MRCLLVVTGFCLALGLLLSAPGPTAAQKPDPKAEKLYEVRIIRVGTSYQAIRFKVKSGETWLADGLKWSKIPETGPLPAGDYEILLVATDQDFSAMRYDRVSGTAWLLRGLKWIKMDEPE